MSCDLNPSCGLRCVEDKAASIQCKCCHKIVSWCVSGVSVSGVRVSGVSVSGVSVSGVRVSGVRVSGVSVSECSMHLLIHLAFDTLNSIYMYIYHFVIILLHPL